MLVETHKVTVHTLPKRAVVAVSLTCDGCGYDLRGVRLEHCCPECGRPVRDTITRAIENGEYEQPRLRNPRSVGNALIWLMGVQLSASILILTEPAILTVATLSNKVVRGGLWSMGWLWVAAGLVAFSGIWSTWIFVRPVVQNVESSVRRPVQVVAVGLIAAAAVFIGGGLLQLAWTDSGGGVIVANPMIEKMVVWLATIIVAMAVFFGDAGILHVIGSRSRAYRQSQGARQGLRAMLYALLCAGVGVTLGGAETAGITDPVALWMTGAGRLIALSATLMVVIGQVYLFANALSIRSALRRPVRRLAELVRIEPDSTFSGSPTSPR